MFAPLNAEDLVNNSFVRIDYPADGSDVSASSITISVSYLWDTNWEDPPSLNNLWRLDISCQLYNSPVIPSSQYKDYPVYESYLDITGPGGGGGSLSVNLAGYPEGNYMVNAALMGPAKYAASDAKFTARETATKFFYYDGSGGIVPPGSNADNPSADSTSGGGMNPVIPVVIGVGAVGLIGLLARNMAVKGKAKTKAPIKPTPQKPGPASGPSKQSNPYIREAENNLIKARKNKALFDRWTRIHNTVTDTRLSLFMDNARGSIIGQNGEINEANLNRLEGLMKNWLRRDVIAPQMPDYTGGQVMLDTVRQASGNIFIRIGAGYLTAGYSEMALNPLSSVSNMGQNILDGDSTAWAVTKGFGQSSFELALGEAGRVIKPLVNYGKQTFNSYRLGQVSSELKSEISTVTQLASQTEEQMTRNAFMRSSEVAKGEGTLYKMTSAEKEALRLNNSTEYRELMAQHSDLLPNEFKEVLGVAKQKAYQQARNNAVNDVMNQMAKDGVPAGENPFFIRQTGTHAQPGNPGWNAAKSDFDHTVEFGSKEYNALYEKQFNAHLEAQGTSAKAMDANIYGEGTSSRGAYEGGAKKFVEHYNETSGSDVMVRNVKGEVHITTETPQTSTSLLSRMNQQDVQTASQNYKTFFEKDVAKAGGDLKSQIVNGSKTVSRDAGAHGVQSVKHFQETGTMGYQPPPAAKVADLIKERGMSIPDAMKKAGYNGSQQDLFNDFKTIMGK